MTTTTSPRDTLAVIIRATDVGPDFDVDGLVASLTDEQVDDAIAGFQRSATEKNDLRDRFAADPVLRAAVCPANTWKDAAARYDVARTAIRIVDAQAEKNGVTPTALAQGLVDTGGTIQNTIDTHGTDPRADGFSGGSNFYAFRYRVRDALDHILADVRRAEQVRIEAERDAAWAAKGYERCDRCGGAGGRNEWPGFDCFDCGGLGATPIGGWNR